MLNLTGRTIEGFYFRTILGTGRFGAVYLATEKIDAGEREVAIKVTIPEIPKDSAENAGVRPQFISRFAREARLIANLNNPRIVPLFRYWAYDSGELANIAFMVMPLMEGGTLHDQVEQGAIPAEQVADWIDQIAEGLSYAHAKGIIHRDIKPSNFLLDAERNVFVSDFGIAMTQTNLDLSVSTGATYAFMAPEQQDAQMVSERSDIYSLGITTFYLLTGRYPFTGQFDHLSKPLPPLRDFGLPDNPQADAVLLQATARSPEDRFTNVTAFASALRHALFSGALVNVSGSLISEKSTLIFLDAPLQTPNPFVGLKAFEQEDRARFFGRSALVESLTTRLGQSGEAGRFLAVVGPSGSGKSSVVRAGLLPALQEGALPGSEQWHYALMTPGENPINELESALLRLYQQIPSLKEQLEGQDGLLRAIKRLPLERDAELVLVIDQFEELFTLTQDEDLRMHFINILMSAVRSAGSRLRLILMLRADFYDRPLVDPRLAGLMQKYTQVVLPMAQAELREAITQPAVQAGAQFEPGLVETIIAEVEGQPGALPLLQYMLTELYARDSQQGRRLKRATYDAIGGVFGALGNTVESLYTGHLDEDGQRAARQVFLRLVTLGEGSEDTRRRAALAEVVETDPAAAQVVELYSAQRLLTRDRNPITQEPTVEVAHEALIREWPRLREWLDESREELLIQRRLTQESTDWVREGRRADYLVSGGRLVQFETFVQTTSLSLTPDEAAFVDSSLARRVREAEAVRRRQRLILGGTLAALIIVSVLALLAFNSAIQEGNARATSEQLGTEIAYQVVTSDANADLAATNSMSEKYARSTSDANATAANESLILADRRADALSSNALADDAIKAILEGDVLRAAAFADFAARIPNPPGLVRQAVAQVAYGSIGIRYRLELSNTRITGIDMSPDGQYFLLTGARTQGENGDVIDRAVLLLYDVSTGNFVREFESIQSVSQARFSPDGLKIAAAEGQSNTILLFDVATGSLEGQLSGHTASVTSLAFSLDGKSLVTGAENGELFLWGLTANEIQARYEGHSGTVTSIDFGFNDEIFVSGGHHGEAFVWNIRQLTPMTNLTANTYIVTIDQRVEAVAFSDTAEFPYLVIGGSGFLWVWEGSDLTSVRTFELVDDTAWVQSLDIQGSALTAGMLSGKLLQWDLVSGQLVRGLMGHQTFLTGVATSSQGPYMITGDFDGVIMLWDFSTASEEVTILPAEPLRDRILSLSPDNELILTANGVKLYIWDAETGTLKYQLEGHQPEIPGASVWGAPIGASIIDVTFSPDGSYLASLSSSGEVLLWNVRNGRLEREFAVPDDVGSLIGGIVSFSPDGRYLAFRGGLPLPSAIDSQKIALIWNVESGTVAHSIQGEALNLEFDPSDENLLTITFADNSVTQLNLLNGEVSEVSNAALFGSSSASNLAQNFDDFPLEENAVVLISPDRHHMLSTVTIGDQAAETTVWDQDTRTPLLTLPGIVTSTFSHDSQYVYSLMLDGSLFRWRIRSFSAMLEWIRENRVIRDLTCSERSQFNIVPVCESQEMQLSETDHPTFTPLPQIPTATVPAFTPVASSTPSPMPSPTNTMTPIPTFVPTATLESWISGVDPLPQVQQFTVDLPHDPYDNTPSTATSEQILDSFVVEASFFNPYSVSTADWNYGYVFGAGSEGYLTLTVGSNQEWKLSSTSAAGQFSILHEGISSDLSVDYPGFNVLRLVVIGKQGYFFINGIETARIELSAYQPGIFGIVTGAWEGADEVEGAITRVQDLRVWPIQTDLSSSAGITPTP